MVELRLTGTREELAALTDVIIKAVPEENLRSISRFYANRREPYSNEGRIYVKIVGFQYDKTQAKKVMDGIEGNDGRLLE